MVSPIAFEQQPLRNESAMIKGRRERARGGGSSSLVLGVAAVVVVGVAGKLISRFYKANKFKDWTAGAPWIDDKVKREKSTTDNQDSNVSILETKKDVVTYVAEKSLSRSLSVELDHSGLPDCIALAPVKCDSEEAENSYQSFSHVDAAEKGNGLFLTYTLEGAIVDVPSEKLFVDQAKNIPSSADLAIQLGSTRSEIMPSGTSQSQMDEEVSRANDQIPELLFYLDRGSEDVQEIDLPTLGDEEVAHISCHCVDDRVRDDLFTTNASECLEAISFSDFKSIQAPADSTVCELSDNDSTKSLEISHHPMAKAMSGQDSWTGVDDSTERPMQAKCVEVIAVDTNHTLDAHRQESWNDNEITSGAHESDSFELASEIREQIKAVTIRSQELAGTESELTLDELNSGISIPVDGSSLPAIKKEVIKTNPVKNHEDGKKEVPIAAENQDKEAYDKLKGDDSSASTSLEKAGVQEEPFKPLPSTEVTRSDEPRRSSLACNSKQDPWKLTTGRNCNINHTSYGVQKEFGEITSAISDRPLVFSTPEILRSTILMVLVATILFVIQHQLESAYAVRPTGT